MPIKEPRNPKRKKNSLEETAEGSCWNPHEEGNRKKRTDYWNEEVKYTSQAKNKSYKKWVKARTEVNRQEYIEKRNPTNRIKRQAMKRSSEKNRERPKGRHGRRQEISV